MKGSMKYVGVPMLALGLLGIPGAGAASGQGTPWTDRGFLNVSFGAQPKARSVTLVDAFPLYDETARIESVVGTSNGLVFDITGGYRVWRSVGAAVGFSRYADSSSTTANASIPDPLFHDTLHASSLDVSDLDHSEKAVHLSVVYVLPLKEKIALSIFAGPSFYSLSKDVPANATINDGDVTIAGIGTNSLSESGTGGHFGVDLRYMVTDRIGGGLLVRYAGASIDAPQVSEGTIDVGGLQYAFGVRVKF